MELQLVFRDASPPARSATFAKKNRFCGCETKALTVKGQGLAAESLNIATSCIRERPAHRLPRHVSQHKGPAGEPGVPLPPTGHRPPGAEDGPVQRHVDVRIGGWVWVRDGGVAAQRAATGLCEFYARHTVRLGAAEAEEEEGSSRCTP